MATKMPGEEWLRRQLDELGKAATVTPIRPDVEIPAEPPPAKLTHTCPVCGVTETEDVFLGNEFLTACQSCGLKMQSRVLLGARRELG